MIFIISPSLSMEECNDWHVNLTIPNRIDMAKKIVNHINELSVGEIMCIMNVNSKIADLNKRRYEKMKFDDKGSPAILAYTGIVYKNINPSIFDNEEVEFCKSKVRILSGLYGVLNPYDSIYEYRLELKTKISVDGKKDLYDYFNTTIYEDLTKEDREIINLCSNEYSKAVKSYVSDQDSFITCNFKISKNGELKTLATDAKAARGRMVNFVVRNKIDKISDLREFDELGYKFEKTLSEANEYVFVK